MPTRSSPYLRATLLTILLSLAHPCLQAADRIGFPSRDPLLDVQPGFRNPPPGYGEVAFYW